MKKKKLNSLSPHLLCSNRAQQE